jgi:hypothetical protein
LGLFLFISLLTYPNIAISEVSVGELNAEALQITADVSGRTTSDFHLGHSRARAMSLVISLYPEQEESGRRNLPQHGLR